jgi:phytanoyl-CoA dioxygenase PhyH
MRPFENLDPVLWLDCVDAHGRAQRLPEAVRSHVLEMVTDGYTVLRDLPTRAYCDEVVRDYYRYCEEQKAADRGKKARIVNFHVYSDAAKHVLLDRRLMQLLDVLFGYEAVLWTSLTFEYGTEQRLHRDSPFFDTRPFGYYFGVWTALEDISPDSGPLSFVPRGHRIPASYDLKASARATAARTAPNANLDYGPLLEQFFSDMDAGCAAAGLRPVSVDVRKGDKIIWHHWLPHGGAPAVKAERTRRSLVGHYIPVGVPIYNCDVFFGITQPDLDRRFEYLTCDERKYVNHPRSEFQKAYI